MSQISDFSVPKFTVDLSLALCFPVNVTFLKRVSHSTTFRDMNYVHNINQKAKTIKLIQDILREFRSIVHIFVVIVVFAKSHAEWTNSLSYVFLLACRTFNPYTPILSYLSVFLRIS